MKQSWVPLSGAAAWLGTLTAAFLSFSVRLSLDTDVELMIGAFTQFVVAAIFGILVAVSTARGREWPRARAARWSIALLLSFTLLFLFYIELTSSWTCHYADRYSLVIGAELKPDALAHVKLNPHLAACNTLIAEYGGDTGKLYDSTQMRLRFITLAVLHTLLWVLAASLVFVVTRLITKKKPRIKTTA